MEKRAFKGTVKLTPKYAECDPIFISGDWSWDEEKKRWFCNNAIPRCYNRIGLADEVCELIIEEIFIERNKIQ